MPLATIANIMSENNFNAILLFLLQAMDSQFSEFNFWKEVIPDIELEINDFLSPSSSVMDLSDIDTTPSSSQEEENPQFNAFNFWKLPVPELALDISSL